MAIKSVKSSTARSGVKALLESLVKLFDELPLEQQPQAIIDLDNRTSALQTALDGSEHDSQVKSLPQLIGADDYQQRLPALVQGGIESGVRVLALHAAANTAKGPAPAGADSFVAGLARMGLFGIEPISRFALESDAGLATLHDLRQRDYRIRQATESDLPRLYQLEELCWQHTRATKQRIRARLQTYPQGQFVLEKGDEVLGVIYSQRIGNADALDGQSAKNVHQLHDETGSVVQLLAVNVDPTVQNLNLGDQLLEFMLQLCSVLPGVDRVVGVTLCKSFDASGPWTFDQYIQLSGADLDPVLAFHRAHGASVVKSIANYRPQDSANQGYGVLVSYDILHRVAKRQEIFADGMDGGTAEAGASAVLSADEIGEHVQALALQMLGDRSDAFDLDRPVMEMGLDSADLLKMQLQLEQQTGSPLPGAFFFQYNTLNKVIAYFSARLAPAGGGSKSTPSARSDQAGQGQPVAAGDIAVIGMSCRLPGGIDTPDDLWRVLSAGTSVIGPYPESRGWWPSADDYPAIDRGGFLRDGDRFDASFFRISPTEAQITDPQQRIVLELAWACLEDAGVLPSELKGSNTGVFVGASNGDYSRLVQEARIETEAHHATGSSLAILANRLSYFFDLSGPSMLIDTACSSSLVALHAAIQSIRGGECPVALVGGVNFICHPDLSIAYHKAGMLSPEAKCKVFDAGANGYVRAEGAVVMLLKPLQQAIEDHDRIHAVIKGTAINHGGLAGGLTVPNPQKQSELLVAAWKNAGIKPEELGYIEAHGTGTSLGDPIEVQGIEQAYAQADGNVKHGQACGFGSVKSNLGHLESAAGLTGLLKVILSMKHGQLPASINFSQLNPKIALDGSALHVVAKTEPWNAGRTRIAGVSSFGSGGANAHAVVQEYRGRAESGARAGGNAHLFVLSAANEERLHHYVGKVVEFLDGTASEGQFADMIYSWQVGRTGLKQRLAVKAGSQAELRNKLQQWMRDRNNVSDTWYGEVNPRKRVTNPLGQGAAARQSLEQAIASKDWAQLGAMWTSGIDIDWRMLYAGSGDHQPRRVGLPTYPFGGERYWVEGAETATGRAVSHAAAAPPASDYGHVFATPVWAEAELPRDEGSSLGNVGQHHLVLCEADNVDVKALAHAMALDHCEQMQPLTPQESLADRYSRYAFACFEKLRAILASKPVGKVLFQIVVPDHEEGAVLAGLSGLLKTASQENPKLVGQLVLAARQVSTGELAARLQQEKGQLGDMIVKYAQGKRYVQSWQPVADALAGHAPVPFKDNGVYLITGGLGGLGRLFVHEILQYGSRMRIILTGRGALSSGKQDLFDELSSHAMRCGSVLEYRQLDLESLEQVSQLIASIQSEYKQLNGVLHSAGVLLDNFILKKPAAEFMQVLAPKVVGLYNLDQASRQIDLDFMVLFSSFASVLGSAGSADYAAANGFMDEFAAYRNNLVEAGARQGRTLSINWPLWKEGGMSIDESSVELQRSMTGMVPLQTALGMQLFHRGVTSAFSQAMFMEGEIGKLHATLASTRRSVAPRPARADVVTVSDGLLADETLKKLKQLFGEVFKLPVSKIDGDEALSTYGIDSIFINKLNIKLAEVFGGISRTLFFEYATLAELTGYLVQEYEAQCVAWTGVAQRHTAREEGATVSDGLLVEGTLKKLKQLFGEVFKLPVGKIDADEPLSTYGIDSIFINKLNVKLAEVFGGISRTLFFEYATLAELTDYLVQAYEAQCVAWTGLTERQAPQAARVSAPAARDAARAAAPASARGQQPIAIIGISGIYPQAPTLEQFWSNLKAGKNSVTEIPAERWPLDGFYNPDPEQAVEQRMSYSKWGGFIDGFAEFDPLFFSMSPREAMNIDPQERLFLQESWRAMENAGYTRSDLKHRFKQRVGVFAGITKPGFMLYTDDVTGRENQFFPYTCFSSTANRVSYYLDVTGPSMPIDTMCSSSLTAIHEGCQHIMRGECDLAFAGGVNVFLHPSSYIWLSSRTMLSRDGLCKSFGAGGNGYVPGEGVGVVLLKPLSSAIEDGDNIHGVILATHVNHGGKANGYTVPNPRAQAALIRQALDKAGIKATDVSYIEAHGTGTELGDPIEISGLQQAFAKDSQETGYCKIGSAKSNIGHLEAAAGIAGLTKVLLQMRHRQVAPSLHSAQINPNIDFDKTAFRVNQTLSPWETRRPGVPRIAGISSFGAGGANAHIIVQEYVAPEHASRPALHHDTVAVPLSAKTAEQLQQRARDLLRFVQTADQPIDLAAVAYTLQVGREAMEERAGFLVNSVDELTDRLKAFIAGEKDDENIFLGQVKSNKATLRLLEDEDFAETLEKWLTRRKYPKLLDLWTKGLDLDWNKLYDQGTPRRVALPGYPFAKQKYWVDALGLSKAPAAAASAAALHPLLHRNTSDLTRQSYTSVFSGDEFFLNDHKVSGQKVFPAVAYLEMARAAVDLAAPHTLKTGVLALHDTAWAKPIAVSGATAVSIGLSLSDDGLIDFDVSTDGGLHCQGQAVYSDEAQPALDIGQLRASMQLGELDVNAVYRTYADMGIDYGPAHQALSAIHRGDGQLLAQLDLPAAIASTQGAYLLHPSLMDCALQASIGLLEDLAQGGKRPLLPFALDSLRVYSACTGTMFAWVRYAAGSSANAGTVKFDVDLCDQHGMVCVQMHGFSSRILEGALGAGALPSSGQEDIKPILHALAPVWSYVPTAKLNKAEPSTSAKILLLNGSQAQLDWIRKAYPQASMLELPAGADIAAIQECLAAQSFDHLLWVAHDVPMEADGPRLVGDIVDQQEQGVLAVFRTAKALLNLGYVDKELEWTLITGNTQIVKPGDRIVPTHGAIFGMVGSMAKEYPDWRVRLLDVDSLASLDAAECLSLPANPKGDGLAYRAGEWFSQGLARIEQLPESSPAYRQGGVYVVIGGAGGIGETWSRFMAEHYGAKLVWIGRQALGPAIEEKIRSVGQFGHAPVYFSADATSLESMQHTLDRILEIYPTIHGVVHSAIVLEDQSVALMDEATFKRGLAAKVDISVNMEKVFGQRDLDFILYFSSLISFLKAPGQSNYSAGCTFKDSFAHYQAQQHRYPVKIMNWGYWGGVGIVTSDFYNRRMQQRGVGSIEPLEAMESLQALVGSGLSQMALMKTLRIEAVEAISLAERVIVFPASGASGLAQTGLAPTPTSLRTPLDELRKNLPSEKMLALMGEILASSLASLGMFTGGARTANPLHERWVGSSIDYLKQHALVDEQARLAPSVRPVEQLWAEWDSHRSAWESNPNMRAQSTLIEACLKALPDILTGKRLATDVMFPESSMRMVEGIYKDNLISDFYNEVLGDTLAACIQSKLDNGQQGQIRILEIGAGTGGTTTKVLPLLKPFADAIVEYCYTDLSKAFLIHAEEQYQPQLPALRTAIFDASKPLAGQGIPSNHFDFVIATNVLHATPDIRETLRNAKATMKKQGVLLLNELSVWTLFHHLTFGLLDGWWLYEDEALRLPGSPALAPEKWQAVLSELGFEPVLFAVEETHALGQQVIAAASDGVVRQHVPKRAASRPEPVVVRPAVAAADKPQPARAVAAVAVAKPVAASHQGLGSEAMLRQKATAYLQDLVAKTLRIDASQIEPGRQLADYGLDSILVVGLTSQLRKVFSGVTSTLFFEVQHINGLVDHILAKNRNELMALVGVSETAPPDRKELSVPARSPAGAGQPAQPVLRQKATVYLKELVAKTLRIDAAQIEPSRLLSDYGLDSILVVGLTSQLRKVFSGITSTLFFEVQHINGLVDHILEKNRNELIALVGASEPVPSSTKESVSPVRVAEPALPTLRQKATAYLKELVAKTLRIDAAQIEPGRPLADYGLDSILVVGLTSQLRKVFSGITSTLFFEVQHINGLVDHILEKNKQELISLVGADEPVPPSQAPVQSLAARAVTAAPAAMASRRVQPAARAVSAPVATSGVVDVAIVGLSGRYPRSPNLHTFWKNLASGSNCVTEIPKERWEWEDYFDPEKGKPGKIYTKWGGFLDDIDKFDPLFFKVSPKDAKGIDPQERLFLETCYHAIEDAGYTPLNLGDIEKIGVFVGVMNSRYTPQSLHYSIANRVSYLLNFQGPSMAVDTACSSSLTAIHLALESLYSGSTECAIAGGVNVIIDPVHYLELSALTMLSSGNQCKSFGADADGFIDAEGVGAVVLKSLDKAERDGDHIYAVIKGSAVNAGGRTNGYTVPNPRAQGAVVAKALERANLEAWQISYIEAHGTGTALGDPIEVAGLTHAFSRTTQDKQFCAIGSLKSNIGHCESAAGIAALTKVLLQLKHRQLVPSLHAQVTNPEIDFAQTPFRIQLTLAEWKRPLREIDGVTKEIPRIAGISSFGAGGANAHLIVQEYVTPMPPANVAGRGPVAVPLSARTMDQLQQKVRDLIAYLDVAKRAGEAPDLASIAYTLQVGRESLVERVGFVVQSVEELEQKLGSFSAGKTDMDGVWQGKIKRHQASALPVGDPDFQRSVEQSLAKQDLATLLDWWVQGVTLDWNKLYGANRPQRASLPTYPFARERYWRERVDNVERVDNAQPVSSPPGVAKLHPLLHANVSDIRQQRYCTTFDEADVLSLGHRMLVNDIGYQVLPAAALLEMARAAVADSMLLDREVANGDDTVELQRVVFADSVVVAPGKKIHVALFACDDSQVDFEIYSQRDDGDEIIHCQGHASIGKRVLPAKIDIGRLQAQTRDGVRNGDNHYNCIEASSGMHYSDAYRGLSSLRIGTTQCLGEIALPQGKSGLGDGLMLHPVMLDCALQAAFDLISPASQASLPWSVESVCMLTPCTSDMVAWVRYANGVDPAQETVQLDVDLCDRQGHVCVQVRGLAYANDHASPPAAEQGSASTQGGGLSPAAVRQATGVVLGEPSAQAGETGAPIQPKKVALVST